MALSDSRGRVVVGSVRVHADDRRMSHESRENADFNFPLTYMGKNVLAPGQIQVEVILEKKKNRNLSRPKQSRQRTHHLFH